jgi:hypothetical protein
MMFEAHVRPKAFSNIRIQDRDTFLCAENAMNVQARESVSHEKKLYRKPEIVQHTYFKFLYSKFHHSNHRIGAHTYMNRTVPPGHFATGSLQELWVECSEREGVNEE